MRRALLASVLLAPALAVPGLGFHNPGLPVLEEVPVDEDAYVAWKLFIPAGAQVSFDIEAAAPLADTVATGLWMMRPDPLRLDSAFMFAAIAGGAPVLHAQVLDPVGTLVSQRGPGHGAQNGLGVTFEPNADGTFIAIAVLAGDAALDGHLVLYGTAGVEVLGRTTGPGFLFREPDFEGTLNVMAQAPAPPVAALPGLRHAVQLKAIEGASVALPVEDHLFMMFTGLSNSFELQMSYDSPQGHTALPCLLNGSVCEAMAMLHGEGAGGYQLNIDHNLDYYDTTLCAPLRCYIPAVWAAGADAALP